MIFLWQIWDIWTIFGTVLCFFVFFFFLCIVYLLLLLVHWITLKEGQVTLLFSLLCTLFLYKDITSLHHCCSCSFLHIARIFIYKVSLVIFILLFLFGGVLYFISFWQCFVSVSLTCLFFQECFILLGISSSSSNTCLLPRSFLHWLFFIVAFSPLSYTFFFCFLFFSLLEIPLTASFPFLLVCPFTSPLVVPENSGK